MENNNIQVVDNGNEIDKEQLNALVNDKVNEVLNDPLLMKRAILNGIVEMLNNQKEIQKLVEQTNQMLNLAVQDKVVEYLTKFSDNVKKQERKNKKKTDTNIQ